MASRRQALRVAPSQSRSRSVSCEKLVRLLHNAECPNEHVFSSLTEARRIIEAWRIDYNEARPHSSLGYQSPESSPRRGPHRRRRARATPRSPQPAIVLGAVKDGPPAALMRRP